AVEKSSAAPSPDNFLASYHFAGMNALENSTNGTQLKKILALPETKKFHEDVVQKLARSLGAILAPGHATANLIPLIEDLEKMESAAELGEKNAALEFSLAVKLSEERSKFWETTLKGFVQATSQPGAANGWEGKINGRNTALRFARAGKWTFVFLGPSPGTGQANFVARVEKISGTPQNFLEADLNWPALKTWMPFGLPLKAARTIIKVNGSGEYLRTTARVVYPEKLEWKAEPWRIPTNAIRDPLISFTAMQRVEPFLKPTKFSQTGFDPLTNQIFFWALSQMPFQSYVALPVNDATNTLKLFGPKVMAAFNDDLKNRDAGVLNIASNKVDLIWQRLPIIVPTLQAAREKNGDFLMGGIFPLVPNTNMAPSELFAQISGRSDVVYYDWEITQYRLSQAGMLSQLFPLFGKERVASTNAAIANRLVPARVPEQKWLAAIGPLLGNTITEVTYKSPTELEITRKSHLGLNSIELVLFSHWLAHPNFPAVDPFATTTEAHTPSAPAPSRKP
ncbi:MAG: hypothetical protein ABJC04_10655, partial [Verrucomicrobiota bacterium]